MKEIHKEWLDWILSMVVLSLVVNFAIILTVAALSGTWSVEVRFNDLGEGPLELVLVLVFILLQSRNIVRQWKDIREEQRIRKIKPWDQVKKPVKKCGEHFYHTLATVPCELVPGHEGPHRSMTADLAQEATKAGNHTRARLLIRRATSKENDMYATAKDAVAKDPILMQALSEGKLIKIDPKLIERRNAFEERAIRSVETRKKLPNPPPLRTAGEVLDERAGRPR